jgi:hypothetical protein
MKMAQYYQNALLNITITGGSSEGFLATKVNKPFERLVRLQDRVSHPITYKIVVAFSY